MKGKGLNRLFILLFVIVVGLLGVFSWNLFFHKENGKNLKIVFRSSSDIMIENKLPISDTLGKQLTGDGMENGIQGYLEFSIENKDSISNEYVIKLTKKELNQNEINGNYIKLYLTKANDYPLDGFEQNPVPSFQQLPVLNSKPNSKVLYRGVIAGNTVEEFRLRMWLADSYAMNSVLEEFSIKIDVE